jgi:pyrroloquinoline quinone biosynthesis protein B
MGLTGIRLGARRVAAFRRNCNCNVCRIAGAGEKRVRTRTLASLAISGDGERWTLINASPDLRAQIQNNRQLHPCGSIRASPIEGSGAHRRGDRPDRRRALAGVSARHSP